MLAAFRQRFPNFGLAHISLLFIGLMWVLPFLHFYHQNPLTTFYPEWSAAVLGICAMSLLVAKRYWQQAEIPRIVLLPVGLLLLVLLQFAVGKGVYFGYTLLVTLYLLWAALLMMVGRQMREELGLPVVATALAVFLLVGAELSAVAGMVQHFNWRSILDYVVAVKTSLAVFGNTGQPNHFANYTVLGLFSLGLLVMRWRMRWWLVALLAAPLLFVLVLSGSRSAWLYLLLMTALAFLWQRGEKAHRPLLHYSVVLLLGFGLMHFAVQIPWLSGSGNSVTTMERLIGAMGDNGAGGASGAHSGSAEGTGGADGSGSAEGSGGAVGNGSIRLHIWYEAWLIFTHNPLLGAGFGQFSWENFQLGPQLRNASITGMYNNAHNLVMHTAAEMGMAGLSILLGSLALWFWQARSAPRTIYHWWGFGLLSVQGIHSLLEYPLWYAYFLGLTAITLGMLDYTSYRLELRGTGRLSVGAILLLGLLTMGQTLRDYSRLERLNLALPPESAMNDSSYSMRVYLQNIRDGLVVLQQSLLLRPYVEFTLGEAGWNHVADNRALNERVLRLIPVGATAYREAFLLARAGRQAEAQEIMERAIWAYPEGFPENFMKLRSLAGMDPNPARYPALLEFSRQKYEERQRAAIRAK